MQTTPASVIPSCFEFEQNDAMVEIGLRAHRDYWQNTPHVQRKSHVMVGTIASEDLQKSDIFITMLVPRGNEIAQLGMTFESLESAEQLAHVILKNVNDVRNEMHH